MFCRARRFLSFRALNPEEGRRGFELSILGLKTPSYAAQWHIFCTPYSPGAGVAEYTEEGCQRIGEQQTLRGKLRHIYSEIDFSVCKIE